VLNGSSYSLVFNAAKSKRMMFLPRGKRWSFQYCTVFTVCHCDWGVSKEGGRWCMPKSPIKWIFTKKRLYWDVWPPSFSTVTVLSTSSVLWSQICQKCIGGAGCAPDPAGELTTLPHTPWSVGDGDTPSPISTPFGASILAPLALSFCALNVKS